MDGAARVGEPDEELGEAATPLPTAGTKTAPRRSTFIGSAAHSAGSCQPAGLHAFSTARPWSVSR